MFLTKGKGHRTCEVCGVKERHEEEKLSFFNFPLDPNRCREWLKAVGNVELVYIPIEKLHSQKNVCGNHFQRNCFNKKQNRLKRYAIPTINLMAPPLQDSQLVEFPQYMFKREAKDLLPDSMVSTSKQDQGSFVESEAVPSTSKQGLPEPVPSTRKRPVVSEAMASISKKKRTPLVELSQNAIAAPNTNATINNQITQALAEQNAAAPNVMTATIKQSTQTLAEQNTLTPRKKKLMEQLRKTKCTLAALRKSAKLIEKLESGVLKEIVTEAIKNQHRKPQGRRWSTKSKISALAIYKRSPKTFRYMQYLMPMPSTKTLHNVLKNLPLCTGVNQVVIEHLKKIFKKKERKGDDNSDDEDNGDEEDNGDKIKKKYCTIVFDEMALKRRLLYDVASDKVEGYEDMGTEYGRTANVANHALVFMIQGVRAKFKQPLAYYFVKGTISSQKLASMLKKVISAVESTGFTVLATICDQGPTNVGALKLLRTMSPPHDVNENYFMCNDKKVYIIFDVPHLLKSIRNNFFKYEQMSMGGLKGHWKHIIKAEERNRNFLYLSKIKKIHVEPKYRAKMKVKYAAQVFSTTVSAVLKLMATQHGETDHDMMQTALLIQDIDRLFDITNGPASPQDVKKGIRENVSQNSIHIQSWNEYRAKLGTVKFHDSCGNQAKNVRCIEGYILTLKTLRDIWLEVSKNGFKYLNLRQLNQDALENLFGLIRQHSPTNNHPTCSLFTAALKTSLISGMTVPHSKNYNCEKDFKTLLIDFHDHVFGHHNKENKELSKQEDTQIMLEVSDPDSIPILSIPEEFETVETSLVEIEDQPTVYVSGFIAATVLKNVNCLVCEHHLKIGNPIDDPIYNYIKLREWWSDKTSLTYPSVSLCRLVDSAKKIFEKEIIPFLHYDNVCQMTVTIFIARCDATSIKCTEHGDKVLKAVYNHLALLFIRRQCQIINNQFTQEEENVADIKKKAQQTGCAK